MRKRLSEQERWNAQEVLAVKGTTQQPDPRREGEGVHKRIATEREHVEVPMPPPDAPPTVRSFYIRRSDIARHGYTAGCKGCVAMRMLKPPQGHSDECRRRVMDLMKE